MKQKDGRKSRRDFSPSFKFEFAQNHNVSSFTWSGHPGPNEKLWKTGKLRKLLKRQAKVCQNFKVLGSKMSRWILLWFERGDCVAQHRHRPWKTEYRRIWWNTVLRLIWLLYFKNLSTWNMRYKVNLTLRKTVVHQLFTNQAKVCYLYTFVVFEVLKAWTRKACTFRERDFKNKNKQGYIRKSGTGLL